MEIEAGSRVVAVWLNLARAIGGTRTLDEMLSVALDSLEAVLGVSRASIHLFDPDGVLRFKAYRNVSPEYRRAVEGLTPWPPDAADPEPLLVPDVTHEPSMLAYLPVLRAEEIAAMAFVPLVSRGRVIGKFMLYFETPREFDEAEVDIATVLGSQIAFAVERTRAEEQARLNGERLRFALDAASMGTWDWDLESQSVRWSDNVERLHGLPPGSFDGTFESYSREIHPEDREKVFASIQRAVATGSQHEVEYRIVAPDGTVRWVEGKGRVERDADGRAVRMRGVCLTVTRRKKAELARVEALEQAHGASQRLAAIVESSGDAIVSKTLDGTVTSWNRAAEAMFGFSGAEAVGRSITMIIPADRLQEEEMVLAQIRAGLSVEIETVRQHKDGTRVPISLTVSPVRDSRGQITGASKIARDIGARKREEAARAELHRRLGALVAASATLLNSLDTASVVAATIGLAQQLLVADGYAIWAAPAQQETWRAVKSAGVSPEFANRIIEATSGDTALAHLESGPLAIEDVSSRRGLERQRAAYEAEGIKSMLVCPMHFGQGGRGTLVFYYRSRRLPGEMDIETGQTLANLVAAAMTTADLYEQLRAERNAAEAGRRRAAFLADATAILSRSLDYEQTVASVAQLAVPDFADWCAVDTLDDGGRLLRLAIAHVDPAKIDALREIDERYPPEPGAAHGIQAVIRTGEPAFIPSITPEMLAAAARDEDHRRMLTALNIQSYICVPLRSAARTLGAMTFVYAGSGRHYTDRDLAFATEVAVRAALAIENAFAYRQVNQLNQVKDEFLATLSHELRTPLNAILGYAQMLSRGTLGPERQAGAIAVLTRNAESLKQMIEDVLDVSRVASGKLRLTVRPVDLAEIVDDAIGTIQPAAHAKGVTLLPAIDKQAPPVSGDPDRLRQIVWNLLSNAVKFSQRGGQVDVRLEAENAAVRIVIRDQGQGIDPAFLPHVFERFRQGDSRGTREQGGLGLGLAIVRELTELHGGTVAAESDGAGKGATFTVTLPSALAGA
jgi:PAS domain S-box-containing protein